MKVTIITIGDELLMGQVADTNASFLARLITRQQWTVSEIRTVSDSYHELHHAITEALSSSQLVLTTGGLGPTADDITKQVLTDIFGGKLYENPEVMANVRHIFSSRGLTMNPLTQSQAMVPDTARIIQNTVGTAPVMWFDHSPTGATLVAMPGVPSETEHLFPNDVLPLLIERFQAPDSRPIHRTIVVEGISESALAEHLASWEASLAPGQHLAYLPDNGLLRLRLDFEGYPESVIDRKLHELCELCAPHVLFTGDESLAAALLHQLNLRSLTCATAESCTGGNIARSLTAIPGASSVVDGGIVAYSNHVKQQVLGVEAATLAEYGAVSEPVVEQMARGACRVTGASLSMATSGIAGPSGGTPDKPVGTVCIGICLNNCVTTVTRRFSGSRDVVVARATNAAMTMALRLLKKL